MRHSPFPPALFLVLTGSLAQAQPEPWDPVQSARGWSRVDRDGSSTFFDPATQTLQTWMKDGGVMSSLDISKAGFAPEKWVLDSQGNAWLISKTTLLQIDKHGKVGKRETLPSEVGDLGWDAKGFALCYRSRTPYIEKRDYKTGQVIWSFGPKPQKEDTASKALQRIAINEDGQVILASGVSFAVETLDAQKGKSIGQTVFTVGDAPAPTLAFGDADRPSLAWWLGHGTAFMGLPGSQNPAAKIQGLVLARLDLAKGILDFHPTGVTEDHVLTGVTETEAVLQAPKGGLVFVPLP